MIRKTFALLIATLFLFALAPNLTQAQDTTLHDTNTAYGVVVNAAALNVRNAPSLNAGITAVVHNGYAYTITGRSTDAKWFRIMLPPHNLMGWVSSSYFNVYNAHLIGTVDVPPTPAPSVVAYGTVKTNGLNVRHTPDPINGQILQVINTGEVYQVTAKSNTTPIWYQIKLVNGTAGWVNGGFLTVANGNLVGVVTSNPLPTPITAVGTVANAYFLNVRSTPNPYVINNIMKIVARGESYPVVGRNADSTWWKISLPNGTAGWVNGRYLNISNAHTVPFSN